MTKAILLSFDVEEFDIPEEYGTTLEDTVKFTVSAQGLKEVLYLLEKLNIKATFFVTANFAINHKSLIQEISRNHEIASHGFYHSDFKVEDLKKSRLTLEEITHRKIIGFRMPRLQPINELEIKNAGYEYNSSMNPTYLPGRYNNFFKPRTVYLSNKLINLPISVTPLIRFPLFWLSFKNLPIPLIKFATKLTINHDRYLNIYFHPWEFTDLTKYRLPAYIKKRSGKEMVQRLEHYLLWLKSQGKFISISQFISER
jgi:peptidoglycan/xylan/chitin deacetylase (PgdA/CDA1 family)